MNEAPPPDLAIITTREDIDLSRSLGVARSRRRARTWIRLPWVRASLPSQGGVAGSTDDEMPAFDARRAA